MSNQKPAKFRVCAHPIIRGQLNTNQNQWAWLYQLSIERWEELIQANMDEEQTEENNTTFYVVKPDSEQVLECPRDIALQAYSDVLSGKTAPAPNGPLANATIKKLNTLGGMRIRPTLTSSESFM
jgi:hypothetical protein